MTNTASSIPIGDAAQSVWKLPPLILHPFADATSPDRLAESSRASLMLQGLLPSGDRTPDQLDLTLLEGRYAEIRMLFYVGKDVLRWIEQCLEFVGRDEELRGRGIKFQSLAAYLIQDPPPAAQKKLRKWGVADFKAIFSRALGLNAMFADAPDRSILTDDFVRNYYRYADLLFACRQQTVFAEMSSREFDFELYASGEYSRMLERSWQE
ncbi:MAG TPA: hypothetical protein VKV15_26455 [Bryobacteraceae bacterium]|nr:hypothetical protein [Bryobacteraceae bacterium]